MNEIKSKIKESSGKVIKVIGIVKIICIIGCIFACIGGIALIAGAPFITEYIEEHPEEAEHIKFTNERGIYSYSHTLEGIEDKKDFLYGIAGECFAGAISIILVIVAFSFLKKAFVHIHDSETPFQESTLKDLKISFIVITVLCFTYSLLFGVVLLLILKCLYNIFKYGCELQTESDETL